MFSYKKPFKQYRECSVIDFQVISLTAVAICFSSTRDFVMRAYFEMQLKDYCAVVKLIIIPICIQ